MAHIEQVIRYDKNHPTEPVGTYRGEVLMVGRSRLRHGRGVMSWRNGARYEGEYRVDMWSGRGVYTFSNGDRYEGELDSDHFHGRGAFRFADGRRLYDGAWAEGRPMGGAALDGDGVVWRAAIPDRCTEMLWIADIWLKDRVSDGWTRAGVTVTAGRPPAEAPGSGEWAGAWAWEGGGRVEGLLRGLRPVAGVETDGDGRRWRVTYDGERTLAEGLVATSRTVRPADPSRPPRTWWRECGQELGDDFSGLAVRHPALSRPAAICVPAAG